MLDFLLVPETYAYLAGAFYVLGLLIINQIALRLMILSGTMFYLLYYFYVADAPLWEAIYISLLIGVANVVGLISLVARQSHLAVPRAHKDIFGHFPSLPPGDFRTLMRLAKRATAQDEIQFTGENEPVSRLYYVISGATKVTKLDDEFTVPAGVFVGEVAFLTGKRASATTLLLEGSEYLEWDTADLRKASARSSRFKLALESVLSLDLAQKVSYSVAPKGPFWRPQIATDIEDASEIPFIHGRG